MNGECTDPRYELELLGREAFVRVGDILHLRPICRVGGLEVDPVTPVARIAQDHAWRDAAGEVRFGAQVLQRNTIPCITYDANLGLLVECYESRAEQPALGCAGLP